MRRERYTPAEQDRIGRATYAVARQNIACEPYDALPDWRRLRWIEAGVAAAAEVAAIDAERIDRWRAERRQANRVSRVS